MGNLYRLVGLRDGRVDNQARGGIPILAFSTRQFRRWAEEVYQI